MSGIRDLDIRCSYAGKGEKILKEFLLPILNHAVSYDRITSFYTIESLLSISQGIQSIFERGGTMRLIVGIHSIPSDLVDASLRRDYLKEQISQVRDEIVKGISTLASSLEKKRLATLAWMIEDGLLEIRAAAVDGQGIFHPKTLIMRDEDGNTVAAIGSSNETGSGLGGNYEQIVAIKSWVAPEDVLEQERFFNELWDNEKEDVTVCEINEEVASTILDAIGAEFPNPHHAGVQVEDANGVIRIASEMPANFFVSGNIPALYQHQERAVIDALSRWPVRVLFADEVGLGKTFEAAATMAFLIRYCGVKRVVILTPKAVLQQWQDELFSHFGIGAWLFDSASRTYISPDGNSISIGRSNPVGKKSPDIMLLSAQFARGNAHSKSVFERSGAILPDLLVVDEAHTARVSKDITGHEKPTLMYKMLEQFAPQIPHLILATATPMQKEASEYHALLKLLGLPKKWRNKRQYQISLDLISSDGTPSVSDANAAGGLLKSTLRMAKPLLNRLSDDERMVVKGLLELGEESDSYDIAIYVQAHWDAFRRAFIKLHPAHLLTVRNTRRSLIEMGYKFPKRNLEEVSISNSTEIQLFYGRVNDYITDVCFSVEKHLFPEKEISVGFVRVSYQQRVASSLYSCQESLRRRLDKILALRNKIAKENSLDPSFLRTLGINSDSDEFDQDELFDADEDYPFDSARREIDIAALLHSANLECTALQPLLDELDELLVSPGDMKIIRSIDLALEHLDRGDKVLLFSRYTDTVDALIAEFKRRSADKKYCYGIYVGQKSVIIRADEIRPCSKDEIKEELATGNLSLMFCSDAASEGLNLQAARVLINVDVPWTPARLEQRIGRVARLGQRASTVEIYNVWYPNSIEARMYRRIQKRLDETNLAVGEFPEVVADGIRNLILQDREQEDDSDYQLQEIRNSAQTKALNELWSYHDESTTTSGLVRSKLFDLCAQNFELASIDESGLGTFSLNGDETVTLSSLEGLDESISLTSRPWKYFDIALGDFGFVRDPMGNPAAFIKKNELSSWLDHEAIVDLFSDKPVRLESIAGSYPKMLPNPSALTLDFAIDCAVPEPPKLWPPICKEE